MSGTMNYWVESVKAKDNEVNTTHSPLCSPKTQIQLIKPAVILFLHAR